MSETVEAICRHLERLTGVIHGAVLLLQEESVDLDALQFAMECRAEIFSQLQAEWKRLPPEGLSDADKVQIGEKTVRLMQIDAQAQELARQHGESALSRLEESHLQRSARELYEGKVAEGAGSFIDRRDV